MNLINSVYQYVQRNIRTVLSDLINMGHTQSAITSNHIVNQAQQLKRTTLLNHSDFLKCIEVVNEICDGLQDHRGRKLILCVKKGTDESMLWKALVRIQCFIVSSTSGNIQSSHLLNLKHFINLYEEITRYLHNKSIESSASSDRQDIDQSNVPSSSSQTTSTTDTQNDTNHDGSKTLSNHSKPTSHTLETSNETITGSHSLSPSNNSPKAASSPTNQHSTQNILNEHPNFMRTEETSMKTSTNDTCNDSDSDECIICMNERPQIILPCSHAYCEKCIEQWQKINKDCPVCRTSVKRGDEGWVIGEVPESSEVEEYGMEYLMSLVERCPLDYDDDEDAFIGAYDEDEDDSD